MPQATPHVRGESWTPAVSWSVCEGGNKFELTRLDGSVVRVRTASLAVVRFVSEVGSRGACAVPPLGERTITA
jgi:hypothetical protein